MSAIVILGSPRSGTSLTAGIFAAHGVWTGRCRSASEINPKGFFENIRLNALRKSGGATRPSVVAVLRAEGWDGGPWLVKHSPYAWQCWLPFEPSFVFVRRDEDAIVRSRRACGLYEGESRFKARAAIQKHNAAMDAIRDEHGGTDVWPESSIDGDYEQLETAFALCGLELDRDLAASFVERDLWHG